VHSEEEWDVAGAVAELPQLSDSDEEEGDEGDRYYFITSRPAPGGDIYHASRVGDVERVTCGFCFTGFSEKLLFVDRVGSLPCAIDLGLTLPLLLRPISLS
jgi:hypothetical protein